MNTRICIRSVDVALWLMVALRGLTSSSDQEIRRSPSDSGGLPCSVPLAEDAPDDSRPPRRALRPADVGPEFRTFWAERRICLLTTVAVDGTPHVVAVGVTVDVEDGLARVIARSGSQKIRNVLAAGGSARVAVTGIDGTSWSTLQGTGTVRADRESVADAERRYAQRYRTPRPHAERVVLEISVDRVLGSVR
jgi:PPOX class probable F420-dependent enzyme